MEELLKSLQGKSMTKKNIFDFLSEINLEELSKENPKNTIVYEDIVIHPIKEEQPQEKKRRGRKPKEQPKEQPKKQPKEQPLIEQPQEKKRRGRKPKEQPKEQSKKILLIEEQSQEKKNRGIHVIVDELLQKTITDINKLECKFCKYVFSTKGNLHKHFNTSALCNIMAYDEFKKVVSNFNT